MTRKRARKTAPKVLRFSASLTLRSAAEQKEALIAAFAEGGAIDLDLGNVTEIDTAGVQLLLLAKGLAAETGKPVRLEPVSEPVREVLDLLELSPQFSLQPAMAEESGA